MGALWIIKNQQEFSKLLDDYKESNNFKTYQRLREKLKENKEVIDLIEEVRKLQKELVKIEHEKKDALPVVEKYHEKLAILEENPLYNSYVKAQKRVNEDLQFIKQELEKTLENILN